VSAAKWHLGLSALTKPTEFLTAMKARIGQSKSQHANFRARMRVSGEPEIENSASATTLAEEGA